ncbi:MAG: DNA-binding response regulator [Sphingobacteriales bacterium]|nr:MAG: DNA-binding response regulator [Sphingobacteriales bacterium]TAF82215.1 MAG: DNA-binding response regulator [Sphingobacteriales bacterium]
MIEKQVILIEDDDVMAKSLLYIIEKRSKKKPLHFLNAELVLTSKVLRTECVILMDIHLPGINGIEATRKIKNKFPKADIIMVSSSDSSEIVFESLKAGAVGYIVKDNIHQCIIPSIIECIHGGAPMSASIARMVATSFNQTQSSVLSDRETDVIKLLSEGQTYTQIATELFIAPNTVRSHIKNIYIKLFATNKSEAIKAAKNQRII